MFKSQKEVAEEEASELEVREPDVSQRAPQNGLKMAGAPLKHDVRLVYTQIKQEERTGRGKGLRKQWQTFKQDHKGGKACKQCWEHTFQMSSSSFFLKSYLFERVTEDPACAGSPPKCAHYPGRARLKPGTPGAPCGWRCALAGSWPRSQGGTPARKL